MKYIHSSESLAIPDKVNVRIKSRLITVEGPRGKLQKDLSHLSVCFSRPSANIINIELHHGSRKNVATLRTVKTLINNLIIGVTKGFKYKMRYVYAHFPINVNLEKNSETGLYDVEIRNFLGEKIVRRVTMHEGVDIEISKSTKDELTITGNSLENVSQSAADIQQICRVRNKDIRKFLDGLKLFCSVMASLKETGDAGVTLGPDGKMTELQDIINDPEMEGLTLYEKKALLVNRELDSHGMGKYQWYIFFLCGMGYMIDLLYAQAFGLVEPAMQQELGFSSRQYAFNLTVLIASVFGLCLGAPSNYNGILILTAFVGFGVGGNIPIDTTITLEFLPQNRRFLLALLSIFQPIGVVVCSGIAYGFVPKYACGVGGLDADGNPLGACSKVSAGQPCCDKASNMGWRYLLFTLGGICLCVFLLRFVLFHFQESPKYLIYRGKDAKAVEVLHNIAKFNGRQSTITLEVFAALTDEDSSVGSGDEQLKKSFGEQLKIELARYKILFSNATMARLTILVWLTYMFDYWGFSIAGTYIKNVYVVCLWFLWFLWLMISLGSLLPKILLLKNREIHVSTAETYRNYVIIYICGVPGVMLGALMYGVPLVGRQLGMIISSALMGISLFIFATINTEASNVGINIMEYFFQSMFNAILYGWTPEAYPAPIRGTACGVASFWGRLFSIVSPLIGTHLLATNINGPLYLAGAGVFVCTVCISLMPRRYMGAKSY
ncbi:MAG: hypothetical protein Q9203_003988 [Teloschistes exilis]